MTSSALDQRVVEDRTVIVFIGDNGDLVPCAGMVDALAVDLGSKAVCVDRGEGVAGAVHAASAVAAADDGDELAVNAQGWLDVNVAKARST